MPWHCKETTALTCETFCQYLGPEAVAALPKAKEQSLMPGYNVFGDGLFFGEAMLKEKMVEVSPPSVPLPLLPALPPLSLLSQEKGGRGRCAEETRLA